MSSDEGPTPDFVQQCPSCGVDQSKGAVLCIACGYHVGLGRHLTLATASERETTAAPDDNPFASPAVPESDRLGTPSQSPEFDLTEAGARRARKVVWAAQSVALTVALVSCMCIPLWGLLVPWYVYHLFGWYQLNSQFAELRNPNSLSPHSELTVQFQDARARGLGPFQDASTLKAGIGCTIPVAPLE